MKVSPDCSPRSSICESLDNCSLEERYTVLQHLGCGTYGRVVLANCKRTSTSVALKILPKKTTKLKDFSREFQYSYYLSPHSNILKTFDVAFQTDSSFVFAQEYAPEGDLFEAIEPQKGFREEVVKLVGKQIGSALEFMHSKRLAHRDVKPENVLVFQSFQKFKLVDFGMTRRSSTWVRKVSNGIPYTPPEIAEAIKGERYVVDSSADVWAFGVLLFCAITGNFPWELAHYSDVFYREWAQYQQRKTNKLPSQWNRFESRALRMFRRLLEPKCQKRSSIREIYKYLDDKWVHHREEPIEVVLQSIESDVSKSAKEQRVSNWLGST
ncbi:unnamed protein product [Dimorphilus gyrociliatus]|uniref:Protein kinase domain-containing protein n=1 Tax=Dimorphilus gyrociliatus TaxID=2664684 RepID=A0A7I8VNM0_9ANNE|nr:unnamed protein product [Dimorphilus gyrociliatus]